MKGLPEGAEKFLTVKTMVNRIVVYLLEKRTYENYTGKPYNSYSIPNKSILERQKKRGKIFPESFIEKLI
jgi:hypothetical protein